MCILYFQITNSVDNIQWNVHCWNKLHIKWIPHTYWIITQLSKHNPYHATTRTGPVYLWSIYTLPLKYMIANLDSNLTMKRQQCYNVSPQWNEKSMGSKCLNSTVDLLLWWRCAVCYRKLWGQMVALACSAVIQIHCSILWNFISLDVLRVFAIMLKKKSRYIAVETKYIAKVSMSDQVCTDKGKDSTLQPCLAPWLDRGTAWRPLE